jgi:hypothetical protein
MRRTYDFHYLEPKTSLSRSVPWHEPLRSPAEIESLATTPVTAMSLGLYYDIELSGFLVNEP